MNGATLRQLLQGAFFGAIFFAVFGTRKIIHTFIAGFHEYETAFFHVSDVFVLAFIIIALIFSRRIIGEFIARRSGIFVAAFLIFSGLSALFAFSKPLAGYVLFRLIIFAVFGMAVAVSAEKGWLKLGRVLSIIFAIALVQSALALYQFSAQSDLGIQILGEPEIHPAIAGIAKAPIEGLSLIRAYGTFPHPNVLAAFLVFGVVAAAYFYVRADWKFHSEIYDWRKGVRANFRVFVANRFTYQRIFSALGIFVISLGLVFTFSRAGWLAAVFGALTFLFLLVLRGYLRPALRLLTVFLAVGLVIYSNFGWAIRPRAHVSVAEPAVVERLAFNEVGLEIIKARPFFGAGIGNQVLYAVKNGIYERFEMDQVYEWQPIHNIYLLLAAEAGLPALAAFLLLVLSVLYRGLRDRRVEAAALTAILTAVLLFGLFDHFFFTLNPGRIMLWLIIGLLLGSSGARSSTDRMHPSEG